jgi:AraC family transcriptional regulator
MSDLRALSNTISFIEKHLCESFDLEDLTVVHGYSRCHFSRLFHAVAGSPLSRYIWKRRLQEAADDLIQTNERMIDVALCYQFSSQESFTRAFSRWFGVSPGKYRKDRTAKVLQLPIDVSKIVIQGGKKMKPEVKELKAWTVMGVLYEGTNENEELKACWAEVGQRAGEIPHAKRNGNWYGLCEPLEENVKDLDLLNKAYSFRYLAGVEVSDVEQVPEGMTVWQIPMQEYAVFPHCGDVEKMGETYQAIYTTWLPESGYEAVYAHDFELYNEEFHPGDSDSTCYIYVPVKKVK